MRRDKATLVGAGVGAALTWMIAPDALAAAGGGAHGFEIGQILLGVSLILLLAKLGGHVFEVRGQPAVLGELVAGILIGNLVLFGVDTFEFFKHEPALDALAEIGIIFLLFTIGLESEMEDLMRVGLSSFLVAVLGVIAPFGLGVLVSSWFLPDAGFMVHLFIGATLTATSVGITARVLKDIGQTDSPEARIILGAAVIDDVLGLMILAIVTGAIAAANAGGEFSNVAVMWIILKAVLFFIGAALIGRFVSPGMFKIASKLRGGGLLLVTALIICFGLSFFAANIGLAPIVGAFAAGLVLSPVHYKDFLDRGEHNIEELIEPINYFMVPIFFVMMGVRVDVSAIARVDILGFAVVLTVVAILGKQACSLGVREPGTNRFAIGLGMIPRGEVGLIFAGIGATLYVSGEQVIAPAVHAVLVFMVIVTTLATPPLLAWSLGPRVKDQASPVLEE